MIWKNNYALNYVDDFVFSSLFHKSFHQGGKDSDFLKSFSEAGIVNEGAADCMQLPLKQLEIDLSHF